MPLKKGASQKTFSHNVSEMVRAGHPQAQAVAAAYRQQREAKRKKRRTTDGEPDVVMLSDDDTILDSVNRRPEGYIACEARVARTGLQRYRGYEVGSDKPNVILYRPPEEVFARDAMRSMANRPVTLTHPKRMVDSTTISKVIKGWAGSEVVRDGEYVRVPLMVCDAAAIDAFESGKARELSVGYTCEIDWTPGETPDGVAYDGVQRHIRANHHALVPKARGGDQLRFGDADDDATCPRCGHRLDDDGDCPECGYEAGDTVDGEVDLEDREFSAEERKKGADEGWAKPDGSYPIRNKSDLANAIRAWGRGGATASDKAWIKKRAKALGAESMLPEDWQADAAPSDGADEEGIRVMPIIRSFDGIPVSFADEVSAAAMERELRKLQDQVENFKGKQAKKFGKNGDDGPDSDDDADDVEAKRKKVTAEDGFKRDIAARDGEISVLKRQLADAQAEVRAGDAKVEARAAERIALIDAAKAILPKDFNDAGKSLAEIRRAAVAAQLSDAEIKDWDDAKVEGAFLTLVRTAQPQRGGAAALADSMTRAISMNPAYRGSPQGVMDAAKAEANKAYDEYCQRLRDGYKQPFAVVRN